MRIRWTPAAAADLEYISDYLQDHQPSYRQPTMRKLYELMGELKQWPHRSRRRLFSPLPHIAVYRVMDQSIEILRIYHTAQNRP